MQFSRPPIDIIPLEIWNKCWTDWDLTLDDYNALSMTCKLFYEICRPQLFGRLVYQSSITSFWRTTLTDEVYKKWETGVTRFQGKLEWLASNPNNARYPRICIFGGLPHDDIHLLYPTYPNSNMLYSSMLSTFKAFLGSCTNLREIFLDEITVDEEIVRSIQKIPVLQKIHLDTVYFSCESTDPLIRLEDLSIMEWMPQTSLSSPRPLRLFSNKALKSLHLQSTAYTSRCLRHFISQGTSDALTTLKLVLDVGIIPILFAFLETCPHLTMLVAENPTDSNFNAPLPSLSSSALSNLRWYEGVASLAAIVVPRRPLHKIIIGDVWDGTINDAQFSSILDDLTRGSVVVKALTLPRMTPHPDVFHAVSEKFPELEELQLEFTMTDEDNSFVTNDDSVPVQEYYDLETPTEITSIPIEENGCPVRPPTSMKGVIYWLCLNKLPLPPTITKLAIMQANQLPRYQQTLKSCLSFAEQHQVLEKLSSHSPNLKNVTFGGRNVQWVVNDDGKWIPEEQYRSYIDLRKELLRRSDNPAGVEAQFLSV